MLSLLQYEFMQRAFLVGILIAIITPCIGIIVVLRRLSMIGDALAHNSLAGVAAGLVIGVNPVLGAVCFAIMAALSMEKIRKSFPKYSEIAIAVIMSTGVGVAGILSGFTKNAADFSSFLFGSIVAISDFELWMVVILSGVVIFASIILYKELFFITFDEELARLGRVPVKTVNFIFVLLTAITISIASRAVGSLVISSLLVLPVATAMQLGKSYKQTFILAILFAVAYTIIGIYISFYAGLKPGGTIVLVGVVAMLIVLIGKRLFNRR